MHDVHICYKFFFFFFFKLIRNYFYCSYIILIIFYDILVIIFHVIQKKGNIDCYCKNIEIGLIQTHLDQCSLFSPTKPKSIDICKRVG